MHKRFEIPDDSGFLGIVNAGAYEAFVAEDWEFSQIEERIISEGKLGHLLFWATGSENMWPVTVTDEPISKNEFRSFKGRIRVTSGVLHLVNFEALTMAAQFENETLPPSHLESENVALENGVYEATVRQLDDPGTLSDESDPPGFEIVLRRIEDAGDAPLNSFESIIWHSL